VQAPRSEDQARSPLQVTIRLQVASGRIIDPITKRLQVLYTLSVLLPILGVVAIAHYWLYFVYDMAASVRAALYMPGGLLLTLGLVLVSGVFHEFGHAAALLPS
jgi:putative peptide zinc metalloprotease protein